MAVNAERIARNTIILYLRMLLVMLIKLYSGRVLLMALGVEDYGTYTVVSSLVALLMFLKWTLRETTQRFLNIEMARGDETRLKKVFAASLRIYLILVVLVLLVTETLGLWFLNHCMNIPEGRMAAANWVYQLCIAAFLFDLMATPYDAAIIAHERISAFAYVGVLGALLSLAIAVILQSVSSDRLIVYALLFFGVNVVLRYVYLAYCRRHFSECRVRPGKIDSTALQEVVDFSLWTASGYIGFEIHLRGVPVLVNLFFGVVVNAALGIMYQVYAAVRGMMNNFMTALKPQIVTSYASEDRAYFRLLVCRSCRVAFCLILLMVVPLVVETDAILDLWLNEVPEYTARFVRIILLTLLLDSWSIVMETTKAATGEVKRYNISILIISILHLALTAGLFLGGFGPEYALYAYFVAILAEQTVRTVLVCRDINLPLSGFASDVLGRGLPAAALAFALPLLLKFLGAPTLAVIVAGLVWPALVSFVVLFNPTERKGFIRMFLRRSAT